jgi:hypothetical protein
MHPAPGSDTPDFSRITYLTYFRVEGRRQYGRSTHVCQSFATSVTAD